MILLLALACVPPSLVGKPPPPEQSPIHVRCFDDGTQSGCMLTVDGYITEPGSFVVPTCMLDPEPGAERLTTWPEALDYYDNAGHQLRCGAGESLPPEVLCTRQAAPPESGHAGVTCILATSEFAEISRPVAPACYSEFSRTEPCVAPTPSITCLSPSRFYLGGTRFTTALSVHLAEEYVPSRLENARELSTWPDSLYGAKGTHCAAGQPLP